MNVTNFGAYLKKKRKEKKLSIKDLAYSIDKIHPLKVQQKIQDWEKNKNTPNLEEIYLLAKILKFNPDEAYQYVIINESKRMNNIIEVKTRKKSRNATTNNTIVIAFKIIRKLIFYALIFIIIFSIYTFINKFFNKDTAKKGLNKLEEKIINSTSPTTKHLSDDEINKRLEQYIK